MLQPTIASVEANLRPAAAPSGKSLARVVWKDASDTSNWRDDHPVNHNIWRVLHPGDGVDGLVDCKVRGGSSPLGRTRKAPEIERFRGCSAGTSRPEIGEKHSAPRRDGGDPGLALHGHGSYPQSGSQGYRGARDVRSCSRVTGEARPCEARLSGLNRLGVARGWVCLVVPAVPPGPL
jgi:hypothetical protein